MSSDGIRMEILCRISAVQSNVKYVHQMGDVKTACVRSPLLMWNQNCHKVVQTGAM